jgi:polyisoprenoid-binding protein YceI
MTHPEIGDNVTAEAPLTDSVLRSRLADGSLAGQWTVDPARSTVELHSRSVWGLVPVKGHFGQVAGEAVISPAGEATGTLRVGAASIDTKNAKRDTHLRSDDFFASDAHSDIVFTAAEIAPAGAGATVTGTLQVRDRTQPLSFPASITVLDDGALQLDAQVTIDRSDFGLNWNQLGMSSMKSTLTVRAVFTRP